MQLVTRQLQAEELVKRKIAVQSIDDPVAISPGVGTLVVEFEAVGLGEPGQIEPMLCPALSVFRRTKQSVYQPFVGIRRRIAKEFVDLFGRRGQPSQVETHAAQERRSIGLRLG